MSTLVYPSFKENIGNGTVDIDGDTFYCSLHTSSHTPNVSNAKFADLDNEVIGTGYTSGGKALENVTWGLVSGNARMDADDPSWDSVSVADVRYAAVYAKKTVGTLVDPLVCLLDLGTAKGVQGGTFTVNLNANGILALS